MKASRAPPTVEHARRRAARRAPGCANAGHEQLLDQLVRQPPAAAVRQQHAAGTRLIGTGHEAPGRIVGGHGAQSPRRRDSLTRACAVAVVRRARALGRDHRRAQRLLRRAARAERRALVRLLQPLQDQAADALRRLLGARCRRRRTALGVEAPRTPARSPRPLCGISPMPRHLRSARPRTPPRPAACAGRLPSRAHRARVLVLDLRAALLELLARTCRRPAGCRAARSR